MQIVPSLEYSNGKVAFPFLGGVVNTCIRC